MKLPKPSVKFSFKPNWKKLGLILVSSLFSAVIFSLILIALPQTEQVLKTVRYDLVQEPAYWQQSYILQLEINPQDEANSAKLISDTKDVIYNRLKTYGVETLTIEQSTADKNKPELTVTVVSNKEKTDIERLVGQRYFIQFVTRKSGINFDDTKNPLVQYDISNYIPTSFTRYHFRTVFVSALKSTTGAEAYFAIYKPWPNDFNNFYNFFDGYAGQYAGIAIDDFVNPIMVPTTKIQNSNGNIQRQPFAIALSTDQKSARIQDLLLNSGVIPVKYVLLKTNNLTINQQDNNYLHHIEIAAAMVIISLVLGLIFKRKEFDSLKFLFIASLPIFTVISAAKISGYAIQPQSLFVAYTVCIAIIAMYSLMNSGYIVKLVSILVLAVIYLTIVSFGKLVIFYLLILLIIALVLEYVYPYYVDLINKSLKK